MVEGRIVPARAGGAPTDGRCRVLFLTRYGRMGASSRYRTLQYQNVLESHGIEVSISPLFDDSYLAGRYTRGRVGIRASARALIRRIAALRYANAYDGVVIEKECIPYLPWWVEKWMVGRGVPYAVDYDDAIFHQYDSSPNPVVRWSLGNKIARVMRGSSLVIAGNRYLADYAEAAGASRVAVLPTVVDLDRYPRVDCDPSPSLTIGWIGSPSTSRYLEAIAPALAEVCEDGRAKVVLIGAGKVDLPGVPVELVPWSEEREVFEMQRCDVGIMPLPDEPWARGKCGFKLIQFMACAKPVIASPVGVNTKIVKDGENGFLASSPKEWADGIRRLQRDRGLRIRLGDAGRRLVEEEYSLAVTGPRMASLLRDAFKPTFSDEAIPANAPTTTLSESRS